MTFHQFSCHRVETSSPFTQCLDAIKAQRHRVGLGFYSPRSATQRGERVTYLSTFGECRGQRAAAFFPLRRRARVTHEMLLY